MPDQPSSAFISYCRDDEEFALRLAQDLKDAGAAVWLDQLDIKPGHSWDNAVERALRAATQMLVILTPTSVSSENVRDEIAYALKQGKIVIPVLYIECEIPLRLERKQHVDFRANYARGVDRLLRELRVDQPDKDVVERAAEAEAERLRVEEQARQEQARKAREETLRREQELKMQAAPPQPKSSGPGPQEAEPKSDVKAAAALQPSVWWKSGWIGLAGGFAVVLIMGFVFSRQSPPSHPDTASQTQPVVAQPTPQQSNLQEVISQPSLSAPPQSPSSSTITSRASPTPEEKPAKEITSPGYTAVPPSPKPARESKPDTADFAREGTALFKSQRYADALPLLAKACEKGNALGCDELGLLYQNDLGVAYDYGKARTLYTKSCDGGSSDGCYDLGSMYFKGLGVPQDYGKAKILYTKACDLGNSNGCSVMGNLYRTGQGVDVNPDLARQYLKKGCDMGNTWGCDRLKEMK